jgi:hypothetical protein
MSISQINTSTLDLARQHLAGQAQDGKVTLEQALNTSIAGTKLKDLPEVKGALTGLTVNGKLEVETILTCVNSRYALAGGDLVPKGSGTPLDARGLDLPGLSGLAEMLLLFIRNNAEQRRAGQEIRLAQSEAIEQKLMDSAADLRNGAIAAMVMGVVSGALSVAGGLVSLGVVGAGIRANQTAPNAPGAAPGAAPGTTGASAAAPAEAPRIQIGAHRAPDVPQPAATAPGAPPAAAPFNPATDMGIIAGKAQAWSGIGGGFGTVFSSIGQGAQGILSAEAKEKDAEAEKMRSQRDQEGDIINAIKDLNQTTLQLVQTLLDKENEAMTRILV